MSVRYDRLALLFYWPFINIVIWGITSMWLQNSLHMPQATQLILTGLVLWQIVFRVNVETAKGFFEELTSRNIISLCATPLHIGEWLSALLLLGVIHMFIITLLSGLLVWSMYDVSILALGWHLLPFMGSLLMSGWWIGLIICSLLIWLGISAQDFVYTVGWVFAPISAIFYPVAALPETAQLVARAIPMSYLFEAMRSLLLTGTYPPEYLGMSYLLNGLYLCMSCSLFLWLIKRARIHGMSSLC